MAVKDERKRERKNYRTFDAEIHKIRAAEDEEEEEVVEDAEATEDDEEETKAAEEESEDETDEDDDGASKGEGQYAMSFSSEEPYERWFGKEILDHGEGAVDLDRINDIGVVLFNHHADKVVGRVVSASVNNGRGEAIIEFDDDEYSQEIKAKVDKGTLKGVSLWYEVDVWEEVSMDSESSDGRFEGPCSIAKKWTPLELSIVSVPADPTVGIGRSEEKEEGNKREMSDVQNAVDAENKRASEISALCRDFGVDPHNYIKDKRSVEEVKDKILKDLKKDKEPVGITGVKEDTFVKAAKDALLIKGGVRLEKPAAGASNLRNMRARDLMNQCAVKDGISNPESRSIDDLLRQFLSPSSSFPAILDAAVDDAYRISYEEAPTSFEEWTSEGTLSDFRPNKGYIMGSAGLFKEIPEGGEVKHDDRTTYDAPERMLRTYGRQFSLTREAIYNDNIGIVTEMPKAYAIAAKRTINKQVYGILADNPVIYDGVNLFDNGHKNIVAQGGKPSKEAIQDMMKKISTQLDHDKNPIYALPKYIVTPIGLGDEVREILGSVTINVQVGGVMTSTNNPLYGRGLEVIEDPTLNFFTNGEYEWYMIADNNTVPTIQVDYLNGNKIPEIRRAEVPGQLGYLWDIILDWGITVLDYRGMVKNKGK